MIQDKTRVRILAGAAVCVILANIIGGIAGIITSSNYYFICLSVWVVAGFAVTLLHGGATVKWKNVCLIILIGAVYSLFFEAMGINFGLFFSKYTYTDNIPGPKLFGFNVYSMIAYGLVCYLTYAAAQATVGQYDNRFRKGDVITVPVIATFYTAALDLATDPIMATVDGSYIWEDRGVYFGIPFQNYIGWLILGYAMYQSFALILYVQSKKGILPPQPAVAKTKLFWACPLVIYAANFLQLPFYCFNGEDRTVLNGFGQSFLVNDVYKGVTIVYALAFFAPAFMALVRVLREKDLD